MRVKEDRTELTERFSASYRSKKFNDFEELEVVRGRKADAHFCTQVGGTNI